ncbi:MAG: aminoglycoside phosphotransferase [Halothiobacillaceae bacterium]|nr:MAG: aminoglycoside phosphotransferase [Halothiobacillaceae bacterium]
MDVRLQQLHHWLQHTLTLPNYTLAPASSDASFRRYFRIQYAGCSQIVMDAPPAHEDCRPFITIATAFKAVGLHVPEVLAQNLDAGFLLLTDLGSQQYLGALNARSVTTLYGDALAALARLQIGGQRAPLLLPGYDRALLQREMALFSDWFLERHLGLTLTPAEQGVLQGTFDRLIESALEQPTVWVHRDYHSRNLMVCDHHNPGVLDFQDAVMGPITYDLVSLLRDCYIAWPAARVEQWVGEYYDRIKGEVDLNGASRADFVRWFDLMGVQRHLKAIGIFVRLHLRDGKPGYLNDIPRTLGYVREVAQRYEELTPFYRLIQERVCG